MSLFVRICNHNALNIKICDAGQTIFPFAVSDGKSRRTGKFQAKSTQKQVDFAQDGSLFEMLVVFCAAPVASNP